MAEKRKLSKSILEMKFMKRTKEKVEKEEEIEETKRLYKSEMLANSSGNDNFIFESSFTVCEELIDGRLSFRGMNKELEAYLEKINAEKQRLIDEQRKDEKDIDDDEMAAQFGKMKKLKKESTDSRFERQDNNIKLLSNKNYAKNYDPERKSNYDSERKSNYAPERKSNYDPERKKNYEPQHKRSKFIRPREDE